MRYAFLIFLTFLISCNNKKVDIPEDVMNHKQMVRTMIDVHILEGKIKKLYLTQDSAKAVYNHYEAMLFQDLGISNEQYERSMDFYIDHMKLLDKVYEEVTDSLLARSKNNNIN